MIHSKESMPVQTPVAQSSPVQLAAFGLALGAWAGVLCVGLDLGTARSLLTYSDSVQLAAFVGVLSAAACAPLCLLVVLACRLFLRRLPETVVLAVLIGAVTQAVLIYILNVTWTLATLPLPWLLAMAALQVMRPAGAGEWLSRAVALLLAGTLCTAALLAVQSAVSWLFVHLIAAAAMLCMLIAAQRLAARRPIVVLTPLLVVAGAVGSLADGSRAWEFQEIDAIVSTQPAATRSNDAPVRPPHVVMIVLDTTRRDHLGCYGETRGLTPRLDRVAADGAVYLDFISPGAWTVPTHASLFTGYFPHTHGCGSQQHRWLDDGFHTLAEMLAGVGYQTVGLTANSYLAEANLMQGFSDFVVLNDRWHHVELYRALHALGAPSKWCDQGAAEGVAALKEWLDHRRRPQKPVFLFINLMEAHWRQFPPMDWRMRYLPPDVGYVEASRVSAGFHGVLWTAGKPRTPRAEEIMRGLYAADVAYQDEMLGRMLDLLEERLGRDNTMLIVTSDHGEGLGEAGLWEHVFSLNDVLIHVPMIVRYPRLFPAGLRVSGQAQLVDVVPTVFDVIGRPCPVTDLPGRSLLPDKFTPHEYAYSQVHPYWGHLERMSAITGLQEDIRRFTSHLRVVRTTDFKFVWSSDDAHQLYDLNADPREESNVIDRHPEMARRLGVELDSWWSQLPPYRPRTGAQGDRKRSGRGMGRIIDLGYMEERR